MLNLKNGIKNTKKTGFTIVELLVVIVVIGILAAITIVSYSGIRNRAVVASMQSDLSNASTQFKMFHIDNGYYPSSISIDCAAEPTNTTRLCLKPSAGNSYTAVGYQNPTPQSFVLTEVNGVNTFHITESSIATSGVYVAPSLAVTDPANWIAVGTQVWGRYNLNVGVRIAGTTEQTNNPGANIVEKYCNGNTDASCNSTDSNGTPYGALYQWDEAMNYSTVEKAQGICPAGSHIPSDNDWKILEVYLGMSPGSAAGQVDSFGLRGTDQGTKLKSTGVSGLNIPIAGYRHGGDGSISALSDTAFLWSSSSSDVTRYLYWNNAAVGRNSHAKVHGFSVRCVGN